MIAEAEAAARDYAAANGYVVTGKETGKSTGKVWDNRQQHILFPCSQQWFSLDRGSAADRTLDRTFDGFLHRSSPCDCRQKKTGTEISPNEKDRMRPVFFYTP